MDTRHEVGGNMTIILDPYDQNQLRQGQYCETRLVSEGTELVTKVTRDPDTSTPTASVHGGNITVYLPETPVTLPLEIEVSRHNPEAIFYFAAAGKIILTAATEL